MSKDKLPGFKPWLCLLGKLFSLSMSQFPVCKMDLTGLLQGLNEISLQCSEWYLSIVSTQ